MIVSSCFAVNFFLNDIMCEYLMSLSTIISIESYSMTVAEFFDFDSLMMKFIVISFHDDFGDFWYWISPYLACVICLFFWQLRHFLMYVSTCCLMLRNWQDCRKSCNVLNTFEWLCSDSSWCSLMISSILSSDMWSRSFSIEYCFCSSLNIRKIALSSCLLADSDSFLLIFRILWLKTFLVFIWSLLRLSASALSFFFSEVYRIVNLYYSSNFDHRICRLLSCFVVIKCKRFLWFVNIVSSDASSAYTLHCFKKATIANNFLSWIS